MIEKNKVVALSYTLTNNNGDILDSADRDDPFFYLHGFHQIVPGLENALQGLKVGDKKNVNVTPTEGYGEYDENLELVLQRSDFPEGAELEEGAEFYGETPQGEHIVFTVTSVDGDTIAVNGNHPLAGETLNFAVEVLSVREATQEELTHGHAHGPDGHHHHH